MEAFRSPNVVTILAIRGEGVAEKAIAYRKSMAKPWHEENVM